MICRLAKPTGLWNPGLSVNLHHHLRQHLIHPSNRLKIMEEYGHSKVSGPDMQWIFTEDCPLVPCLKPCVLADMDIHGLPPQDVKIIVASYAAWIVSAVMFWSFS